LLGLLGTVTGMMATFGALGSGDIGASAGAITGGVGEALIATAFGLVRVKRAWFEGRPLAAAPEFEDCRRLALAAGAPWREVYRAALTAAEALPRR
jgi:uncharacterized protein (DUF111 family)